MGTAESLAVISAGVFFLVGLLKGIWKYRQIMASETGEAHPYVDLCHRASLLSSFTAILLAKFATVGGMQVSSGVISVHMWMLLTAGVGGFLILFYAVLRAVF